MIKKRFLTAAVSVMALSALAYTEVSEVMTITLRSGETQEINIEDIAEVSFLEKTKVVSFELTPADGSDTIVTESIPTFFRMVPKEEGGSTSFAFGSAEAESVADLCKQPYAVSLSLSALSVYKGEIDLTETAKGGLTIYKYEDGAVATSWSTVKAGKVVSSRDIRGIVTITIEAEMEEGPTLYATFTGKVKDVDSLDDMNPAPVYHNEVLKFNMDGNVELNDKIVSVSKQLDKTSGRTRFEFELEKNSFYTVRVEMKESLFGSQVSVPDVASSERGDIHLRYESIQLYSPNERSYFVPDVATVMIVDHGDGTYTIEADFTNKYHYNDFSGNPMTGGTPERVIIQYTGAVE